jgi:hypothetical protein
MRKLVVGLTSLIMSSAFAQWIPNENKYYAYRPICGETRHQVKVRLIDGTKFLMETDVPSDTILYGVHASDKDARPGRAPRQAQIFCVPHVEKEMSFWSSYSSKEKYAHSRAVGYSQCMVDLDGDGIFDETASSGFTSKTAKDIDKSSHQYKYEILAADGPVDAGCPRKSEILLVSQKAWDYLGQAEKEELQSKGTIEVLPNTSVGTVVQVQQLNEFTPGSNVGSAIGERVAVANYVDNTNNISGKGLLGAQLGGALLGSFFNSDPKQRVFERYTIKTIDGDLVNIDKERNPAAFSIPNGTCLEIANMQTLDQSVCDGTASKLKEKYLKQAQMVTAPAPSSKEARLKQLKDLFEKGLIGADIYKDEQRRVLTD